MRREEKEKFVTDFKEIVENSNGVIFTDYRGIDGSSITKLRMEFSANGIQHKVIKNTLGRLVFEDEDYQDEIIEILKTGMTSITIVEEDPFTPARILHKFSKENEIMEVKGFLLSGRFLNEKEINDLSKISSNEEIYFRCVNSLIYPIQSLHTNLSALISKIVIVLNEVAKSKGEDSN